MVLEGGAVSYERGDPVGVLREEVVDDDNLGADIQEYLPRSGETSEQRALQGYLIDNKKALP